MTRQELLKLLKEADRNFILEKNPRHKEMLRQILSLYKETLKQDRSDQAEDRLIKWIKESLSD